MFLLSNEVKETSSYFSILKAISMENHRISEIVIVLEQKTNELRPYLATLVDLCKSEKIDFNISRIDSYWSSNTEIYVVALDEQNKRLLAGECKFYEKPVGIRLYSKLLKNVKAYRSLKGIKL